jgi:hypothetical protein
VFRDHDLSALNANGRNWASYKRVTVLRRPTILDCVAAVQARDADAFVATDLEGTFLLRKLGLAQFYTMQARPLATRGVHAIVARQHQNGAELLNVLNQGLKKLKEGDAYATLVQKHLVTVTSPPVPVPVQTRRKDLPTATQPLPKIAAPSTVSTPPRASSPPPVLDPSKRELALKYLKRGNEELAEGRVAPARLLFERAAEMGLAQAAMALAATYDPAELKQRHLLTVLPDPAEARRWYERAHALGAAEASARLLRLGAVGGGG